MSKKTEKEIKDMVLAWAVRRRVLLTQDSIDDLAKEISKRFIGRPRRPAILEDTAYHLEYIDFETVTLTQERKETRDDRAHDGREVFENVGGS